MKAVRDTKVSQLMSREVKTCFPGDVLSRAAQLMWDHDCGFVPVVEVGPEGNRLVVGVITDRDVCMATYTKGLAPDSIPVADVMSHGVRTARQDDAPRAAAATMRQHHVRRLPVVDPRGNLVGVLSLTDLVRWAARERESTAGLAQLEEAAVTLATVSEPWCLIRSGTTWSKIGSRSERRAISTADMALSRRQSSDEQC